MRDFVFTSQPQRVIFGPGSLAGLGAEASALGAKRALVLCTPEQRDQAQRVSELLGTQSAGVFDSAAMHVPIETARQARAKALELGADCAVAIGGGSTTGLGKAIALESALPIIAIPTTYAGSEMTPIYGITEAGLKRTGKDPRVLPRVVLYDPELTLSLPTWLSVVSGINAIAHAAEGLYARDSNPIMDLMAHEGIRALARALPLLCAQPGNIDARSDALYGAWLCGSVLGNVGMALHHKLCHVLGGSFNLPHAQTHTVILPHAIAFNAAAAPQAMERIADALATTHSAARGLFELAQTNGAPISLKEIGMRAQDLDRAADIATANPYWNPRPVGPQQRNEIRQLLEHAYQGIAPD
jgi:alcohol dehydrogenase class IV